MDQRMNDNTTHNGNQLFGNTFQNSSFHFENGHGAIVTAECLRSLSFSTIDARQYDITGPQPGTCDWIFQTDAFIEWEQRNDLPAHNGILWIKGKPGAGKSTLMKYIWRCITQKYQDHLTAAYFFHSRGSTLEKSLLGMFRSLVFQLLEQDQDLLKRFMPRFRKKSLKNTGPWEWHVAELRDFLLEERSKQPTIVFVDALDECMDAEVRQAVSFLSTLGTRSVGKHEMRICLSSRHYPAISMPKNLSLVVEERVEHDADINVYISENLTVKDPAIMQVILSKASGVFMWIILVVELINRAYDEGDLDAASQALENTPEDLDQLFDMILKRDNHNIERTILLFQWVLFAREQLKYPTLYVAITGADELPDPAIMKRFLITTSRGLIEIRENHILLPQPEIPGALPSAEAYDSIATVQFIHQSVRDFLTRNGRLQKLLSLSQPEISPVCHEALARSCLMQVAKALEKFSSSDKRRQHTCPLVRYAEDNALYHANLALQRPEEQGKDICLPGKWYSVSIGTISKLTPVTSPLGGLGKPGEKLAIAEAFSYTITLQPILFILVGNAYLNALEKALKIPGIDLTEENHPFPDEFEVDPEASEDDMMDESDPDPKEQARLKIKQLATPMHLAAYNGDTKAMAILKSAGVSLNHCNARGVSPLYVAVWRGWRSAVRFLLAAGADANCGSNDFESPLFLAIEQRKADIVEMLVKSRADPNKGSHFCPLAKATLHHDGNVVEALLRGGADVNNAGCANLLPLGRAVVMESVWLIALLLNAGADVNGRDGGWYGTALCIATGLKSTGIIRILVEAGADVHAKSNQGVSVWQLAGRGTRNAEIDEILLGAGATPD